MDDDLAGPHPVLPGNGRRIGFYATESDARHAAQDLDEPLEAKAPIVDDMDAVHAWALDAKAETIDYARLMSAWHALVHLGLLDRMPVELDRSAPDYVLSEIADKIHIGYHLATDSASPFTAPVWTSGEVATLAETLVRGLNALDDVLRDC